MNILPHQTETKFLLKGPASPFNEIALTAWVRKQAKQVRFLSEMGISYWSDVLLVVQFFSNFFFFFSFFVNCITAEQQE